MNKNINIQTNTWLSYTYKLTNNILTVSLINRAVTDFKNTVLDKLSEDQYLLIIFKIKCSDNLIRSISTVQRINKISNVEEVFTEYWSLRSDNYLQFKIEEIIFNYCIIKPNNQITEQKISKAHSKIEYNTNLLRVGSLNFPQTMDINEWGDVQYILNDKEAIVLKYKSKARYLIKFFDHKMIVKYVINNKTIITFTDELLDINNLGIFKRLIKNQTFYFNDGKLDYKEKLYNFPVIKKINVTNYTSLNSKAI